MAPRNDRLTDERLTARRLAVQLFVQLPDNKDTANAVIEELKELVALRWTRNFAHPTAFHHLRIRPRFEESFLFGLLDCSRHLGGHEIVLV